MCSDTAPARAPALSAPPQDAPGRLLLLHTVTATATATDVERTSTYVNSGVKHEVNKATVPQLISELKQAQNGVTTAKSSIVDCMTEII